ncbi:hypothetical protein SISNIDRAFT_553545 [Sistotremastrum niveocremeum HHB9708]|uniref:Uncharacterized protein n=1 Tax=Sistotremastrum niveocremeum HHB9708 TaxID=1314777 RepID=A0A164M6D6_9AGAM|nr:hypothetical protein SISNIDRAFT_553545 [Sistotremastrum niveocremeum HHB9708]
MNKNNQKDRRTGPGPVFLGPVLVAGPTKSQGPGPQISPGPASKNAKDRTGPDLQTLPLIICDYSDACEQCLKLINRFRLCGLDVVGWVKGAEHDEAGEKRGTVMADADVGGQMLKTRWRRLAGGSDGDDLERWMYWHDHDDGWMDVVKVECDEEERAVAASMAGVDEDARVLYSS